MPPSLIRKYARKYVFNVEYLLKNQALCRKSSTFNSGTRNFDDYDVVVVGGGPAGLAFINALLSSASSRSSLKIALVEAGDLNKIRNWTPSSDTFSNRASSITNSSRAFLTAIGSWKYVDEARTSPVQEMQVWDGISDSRITFSARDASLKIHEAPSLDQAYEMARMTENLNLQRALMRNLDDLGTDYLQIIDNTKVDSITKGASDIGGWPLVHTSDGRTLRTRLLVGADGFNSPVRLFAGIESYGWPYDTRAIVATLIHAPRRLGLEISNTTAYQRFLPTGPIAFLPLSPTTSSLVWSTKPALAAALTSADPSILAMMINAAFRLPAVSMRYLHDLILSATTANKSPLSPLYLRDEIEWRELSHSIDPNSAYSSIDVESSSIGIPPEGSQALPPLITSIQPNSIASFPLRLSHADSYIGDTERSSRTVLLGDAAHTIHPLAGQGLNMGLADAQILAACIHQAVAIGGDIGSYTSLHPYARARYFENHKLLSATDKLHKLYSSEIGPVVWARSVGLEVLNELDSVKAAIMISAGANATSSYRSDGLSQSNSAGMVSPLSNITSKGFEILAEGIDASKVAGKSIRALAASGLRNFLETPERK